MPLKIMAGETIVDDVLSKLQEANLAIPRTFTFDPETVEGLQVSDNNKCFGIRCSVEVKNSFNFEVVPDNWITEVIVEEEEI